MSPWSEMNEEAADYIVSLWGDRRRDFARRYWAFLAWEMPKPALSDCFGADRIKDRLIEIKQTHRWNWYWWDT